jgi:hypothetical protein
VANYNANINLTVTGQNRLDYILASVEKLDSIVSRLKPINLLAPGAGAGGDAIRTAKKQLDDFARAVINFEPQGIQKRAKELSNTLAGSAAQADALSVALANVGLKSGTFKDQAAEVKNYALALDTATKNADRLSAISRSVTRGARVENIASRFGTTSEAVEQRILNIRNIRYKKQREAAADEFMQQKRAEDFELRLNAIFEKRQKAKQDRTTAENVALGAGFPLLFGAGPGAVVGGALGGLIPGNPMLSVVTSAVGAQLDAAIAKISELGIGLRQLDFDRLEQSGLRVSQVLKEQVQLLVRLGQTSQAYQVLQQEAARITGTLPGTITDISNATGILNSAWSEFTNVASTTLGIVGAPFAAALGGLVKLVSELLKGVNSVVSLFAEGLKTVGEWSIRLVAGEEGLKRVKDLIDSINRSTGQGNAEFMQSNLVPLNEEIVLNRQILDIQKQRTAETTLSGKIQNSNITYTVQTLKNEQKYTESVVQLNEKKNSISKELYQQGLRQLQVIRAQSDEYAKQTRDLEVQQARRQETERLLREQEEQARTRQQAIEEAVREEQRFRQSMLSMRKEENDLVASGLDVYADYLKATKGVEASLESQLLYFNDYVQARLTALSYERTAAQEAAKTVKEEEKILQLYELKKQQLENQLATRQALLRTQQMQAIYEAADAQGILSADKQRGLGKAFTRFQPDAPAAFGSALNLDLANDGVQQLETYQKELDKLTGKTNVVKQSAEGISAAFSGAFQGLITGAQTAQETLAGFFKGVADAFINMATEIITKMLTMYVFKSLLGLFGGGGGSLFSGQGPVAMPGAGVGGGASMFMPGAPSFRANGGPVTGGSPYVVGERGPELFVPGTGGSVVSNNDLRSAMGSAPGMGGSPVLNMSFETTSIGGVEYVSRDQLELAMAATRRQAARDGAQRGMTMTLDRLQQSPNTRRRVGF